MAEVVFVVAVGGVCGVVGVPQGRAHVVDGRVQHIPTGKGGVGKRSRPHVVDGGV